MSAHPIICLDLGGVVIRHCRSWQEGCAAAGVRFDPESSPDHPLHAAARQDLVHRLTCGALDADGFVRALSGLTQGRTSEADVRRVHEHWITGEYEGVGELIEELNAAGVRTSCLSNTDAVHWAWMHRHSPAFRSIRVRHASHLLGMAKPDPRIFDAFAERVGARAADIVLLDDLQPNIDAARAAGWRAYRIDHLRCTATQLREIMSRLGLPVRATLA
jgi:FMN phosphatase YigB (HAD superfamily)